MVTAASASSAARSRLLASLFKAKFQTPYGPGKAKSPVSSAFPKAKAKPLKHFYGGKWYKSAAEAPHSSIILESTPNGLADLVAMYKTEFMPWYGQNLIGAKVIDQVFQSSPWMSYLNGNGLKNKMNPYVGIASNVGWDSSYYGQVGRALGFTEQEIRYLVSANDNGISFAIIAALIEEHPPVLSSAYTEHRKAEETAFCANVKAAIDHKNGTRKPNPASGWTWAKYEDHIFITESVDNLKPTKPSEEYWTFDHWKSTGQMNYSNQELSNAVNASYKNMMYLMNVGN